ncbi:MAG: leucine-rich repeat domain-containing protein [Ruminococcaceae bacterium]|nr:leucine-rich repeat domain-containing protein [Oscillospiraceae bacterium]
MNEQKFFELMSEIDSEYIMNADVSIPYYRKRGFKISLIAASLALAILLSPIAGAFALASGYKATHPEFKGNHIQALDKLLGLQDKDHGGLLNSSLLDVDWNALGDALTEEGGPDWKQFFDVLGGQENEDSQESVFQTVEIDQSSLRIVAYSGKQDVVIIPETINGMMVTEIGELAFAEDLTMVHLVIPDTVVLIDDSAFVGCLNLQSVKMSSNIQIIGECAFNACHSLCEIDLPDTLHTLGYRAFGSCRALEQIRIPASLRTWEGCTFASSGLQTAEIEQGVKTIPEMTFCNAESLQYLTIPASVEVIEQYAFEGCESLTDVTLQNGLISIGRDAFARTGLQSLRVPATVLEMYDVNFNGCRDFEQLIFAKDAPTVLHPNGYFTDDSELATLPDDGIPSIDFYPDYSVYYYPDAKGFSDSQWHGHPCELMVCPTDPIVADSPFDYIPFHKETVLGSVQNIGSLPEVMLIETYAEYLEVKQALQTANQELTYLFAYEETYFEKFSLVLIRFHHLQSEQVLGLAGLVSGPSTELPGSSATGEDIQTLAAVVKISTDNTSGEISIMDVRRTYMTAEIKKSAYGEFGAIAIYAYNVSGGTSGGAMNQGFPPTVE